VKFGFRLLYNEFAWSYDIVSWVVSLGHWRKWQLAAVAHVQGARVLEIAHGPGHILLELHQRGFQVIGIDLSAAMGRQARARLRRNELTTAVPLVQSRVQALPFAAASFDTVLSQFPTAFIGESETLRAIHHVLAPHGRLVILPEGHLTGEGIIYRIIGWLFTITGQKINDEVARQQVWEGFRQAMAQNGFQAEVKTITLKGSAATVIIATKL
jgi:ubiquinone/menaquinone biosynthesis C-methylase UbiE